MNKTMTSFLGLAAALAVATTTMRASAVLFVGNVSAAGCHDNFTNPDALLCPIIESPSFTRSQYAPGVWLWYSGTNTKPTAQNCVQDEDDTSFSCGSTVTFSGSVEGRYILKPTSLPTGWAGTLANFLYIAVNNASGPGVGFPSGSRDSVTAVLGYGW